MIDEACVPPTDPSSLQADLASVAALDAVPLILDVVCRTTGMGFAAVARVTEERWIACAVRDDIGFGLKPGGELQVRTTICDEIRCSGEAVIIDHVAEDPHFRTHHTPRQYGFQSYISMPIRLADGAFFGTLCAIDPRPARLNTPEVIGMFKLFAELIAVHLDSQDRLAQSRAALLDAREAGELRDQFIAVLGHDLRNPLASVDAGTRILRRSPLDRKSTQVLDLMHQSVLRMAKLIDNVLDFARGRLGDGLQIEARADPGLEEALRHVIAELESTRRDQQIVVDIALDEPVTADTARICQLLSNLLGNALTHGAPDEPVRVDVSTTSSQFVLSVTNLGPTISPETGARLFQPFSRPEQRGVQEGLGLGLYIAAQIAQAHGGAIDVVSKDGQTRFTFRMPRTATPATSGN